MSLARVTTQRAAKPYECDRCRAPIAKGETYRAFKVGFRSRHRYIRCSKAECTPRDSELESSKLAGVYSAIESGHDDVDAATSLEDITAALEATAEEIRSVASEYTEAADAMGEAGYEMTEKADTLESSADTLESTSLSDPEECDRCNGTGELVNPRRDEAVECPFCVGGFVAESLQVARDEAHDALNDVEMP